MIQRASTGAQQQHRRRTREQARARSATPPSRPSFGSAAGDGGRDAERGDDRAGDVRRRRLAAVGAANSSRMAATGAIFAARRAGASADEQGDQRCRARS